MNSERRSPKIAKLGRNFILSQIECASSTTTSVMLSYHALSRQYLVNRGKHQQSFETLIEAKEELAQLNDWKVIDKSLIETFLASMEMDLDNQNYSKEKYEQYILGSAEVVGLMCLHVFTEGDKNIYKELEPFAMKLGAAFQKVNFLRDIKADYQTLERNYFPNVDMKQFTSQAKSRIENEIDIDFKMALIGIKKLPPSSKGGVYLAYVYYKSLFNKIKSVPAERVLTERIRISNGGKLRLMFNSMLYYKMNLV